MKKQNCYLSHGILILKSKNILGKLKFILREKYSLCFHTGLSIACGQL